MEPFTSAALFVKSVSASNGSFGRIQGIRTFSERQMQMAVRFTF